MLTIDPPPERLLGGRHRHGPVILAGDVEVQVPAGLLAQLGRYVLALVVPHVAKDHPGALGHEVPHVGLAHAPGAAGNQRDLPVQPPHPPSRTALARTRHGPYQTLARDEPSAIRPKLERVTVF